MFSKYVRFVWLVLPAISLVLCLNFIRLNISGVYYLTGPNQNWITYGPYFLLVFFLISTLAFFVRAPQVEEDEDKPPFFKRASIVLFKFFCNIMSVQLSYTAFRTLKLENDRLDSINLFGDRLSFLSNYILHRKWSFLELQEALMFKLDQLNLLMPSEEKDAIISRSQGSMENLNILIQEWVQKLLAPAPPLSFRQHVINNLTSYVNSTLNFAFDNPKTTLTIVIFSSLLLYSSWSYFSAPVPDSISAPVPDSIFLRLDHLENDVRDINNHLGFSSTLIRQTTNTIFVVERRVKDLIDQRFGVCQNDLAYNFSMIQALSVATECAIDQDVLDEFLKQNGFADVPPGGSIVEFSAPQAAPAHLSVNNNNNSN